MNQDETPWWIPFFRATWGDLQRAGYPPERTRPEVDFICGSLELSAGARVLDIPCGDGRHSIELASRGMRVCGVDLNETAILVARERAAERGVEVEFQEADMRFFRDDEAFDAAFCFFGSFGYFEEAENQEVALNVSRSLRPGGRFLIDTPVIESLFPRFRERDWHWDGEPPNAVRVLEERRWNFETGRVESTWTFVGPEGITSQDLSIRIYSCRELIVLLRQAGFRDFRALETGSGAPFKLGSNRLSLVATK